jgi:hypothetical protein
VADEWALSGRRGGSVDLWAHSGRAYPVHSWKVLELNSPLTVSVYVIKWTMKRTFSWYLCLLPPKLMSSCPSHNLDSFFGTMACPGQFGGQVAGDRNDPQPKFWAVLSLKDPSMAKLPLDKLAEKFQDVATMNASSNEAYHRWLQGFKKAKKNTKKIPLYPTQDPEAWSDVWNVEIIYLRPGDIL